MNTVDLIEHLLGIVDEIIFPALALWGAYYFRRWVTGSITFKTPPTRKEPQP